MKPEPKATCQPATNQPPSHPNRRQALTSLAATTLALPVLGQAANCQAESPLSTVAGRIERRTTSLTTLKQLAIDDYASNMARFGGKLHSPIASLLTTPPTRCVPWQFDVLVIGSGYGAAVTAARLARRLRPGGRLAIVERGQEWVPGTFPTASVTWLTLRATDCS